MINPPDNRLRSGSGAVGRPSLSVEWEDRLIWAGSETAGLTDHSNGYLEGAVEAGNRAAALVTKLLA